MIKERQKRWALAHIVTNYLLVNSHIPQGIGFILADLIPKKYLREKASLSKRCGGRISFYN